VASDSTSSRQYHPRHVVHASNLTLQECLALSDVVVSAVPDVKYKVKTEWLKDGCVCLNVAADKNFEKDVRDKVRLQEFLNALDILDIVLGVPLHPGCRESDNSYASS
jgi:methylenetetrahydrofolate dehydrogenase (NAD+)